MEIIQQSSEINIILKHKLIKLVSLMKNEKIQNETKTNYKKWSFKFLIYIVLLNFLIAFIAINALTTTTLKIQLDGYETPKDNMDTYLMIISIMLTLLLISGIILTILSVKNKEDKNYQYKVSVWGYPIFIMLSLIAMLYK